MPRRSKTSPSASSRVKFAPRLSAESNAKPSRDPPAQLDTLGEPGVRPPPPTIQPNSKCTAHHRPKSNIIQVGPLHGHPKRQPTDKRDALDLDQVRGLINAFAFAESTARPLNAHLTVTWRHAWDYCEGTLPAMQVRLLDRVTRFLRRHGVCTSYIWVRERVSRQGLHTHVLLHLGPIPGRMAGKLKQFIDESLILAPGGAHVSHAAYGAGTARMRLGTLKYLLKGLDPAAFKYLGWSGEELNVGEELGIADYGPQGHISIKRCGFSQNVGPAERKRVGWEERRDLPALRIVLAGEGAPGPRRISSTAAEMKNGIPLRRLMKKNGKAG